MLIHSSSSLHNQQISKKISNLDDLKKDLSSPETAPSSPWTTASPPSITPCFYLSLFLLLELSGGETVPIEKEVFRRDGTKLPLPLLRRSKDFIGTKYTGFGVLPIQELGKRGPFLFLSFSFANEDMFLWLLWSI
ncbi:hypothetical protein MRB53_021605 [Persea americana]|uniref:Uncharacterized protein n=1 Tax=Persea americana TaxID=3435 RepID=A0ACC2L4V7_PERAE|nr:hypothetical protein MRB53_021605 [Persea americana]